MKKNYLPLLVASLFAIPCLPAQTLSFPLVQDSSHYRYYDQNTGEVQFGSFGYNTYDSDNLPLEDLYINFYGTTATYFRYNYEYNAEKLMAKSTVLRSLDSSTGPWGNWLKDEYTYDAQGRNNFYIGQFGNGADTWENYYQETFGFDDAAHTDSSLYELWNTTTSLWGNYRRFYNSYSAVGDLVQHAEDEWDMDNPVWLDLLDKDYTYNLDGNVFTHKSISYNVGQVSQIQTDSFLYLSNGKLDSAFLAYQSSFSSAPSHFISKSVYDASGHLIEITGILQAPGSQDWRPSSRKIFIPSNSQFSDDPALERQETYNTSTNSYDVLWETHRQFTDLGGSTILYREEYKQKDNQGVLATQSVDSVWYHLTTVNTNTATGPAKVDCKFANPFRAGSCIECNAPDPNSKISIRIMNVSGQVVAQGRVMPGETWRPGADWPAGPYFVTVWQNGQYLGQKKMMVAK